MPSQRKAAKVDSDYAFQGPNRATLQQDVAQPAEVVFRILADGPAWKEWFGIDFEWTAPPPHQVGSTFDVVISRVLRRRLQVLVWEEGRRLGFRFDSCTLPFDAFGEDWLITPTGDNACRVTWSYAYEWSGPLAGVTGRAIGVGIQINGKRGLRRLAEFAQSTSDFTA